jgi:hypothetical protein
LVANQTNKKAKKQNERKSLLICKQKERIVLLQNGLFAKQVEWSSNQTKKYKEEKKKKGKKKLPQHTVQENCKCLHGSFFCTMNVFAHGQNFVILSFSLFVFEYCAFFILGTQKLISTDGGKWWAVWNALQFNRTFCTSVSEQMKGCKGSLLTTSMRQALA